MSRFYNRTRTSQSIPVKLLQQGQFFMLPLYYLLLTSFLGHEGIYHSGSYRFADHIYSNQPCGRFYIGTLLDRLLLSFPSAHAFRFRYQSAKQEIHRLLACPTATGERLRILSVPCGYAREIFEIASVEHSHQLPRNPVSWYGVDLDPELVDVLQSRVRTYHLDNVHLCVADAMRTLPYSGNFHMIISLGFTEFLPDDLVVQFYHLVRSQLHPGGSLVTSGMQAHKLSDFLLRTFGELHTHYRSEGQLRTLMNQAGFKHIRTYQDKYKLQTMIVGRP